MNCVCLRLVPKSAALAISSSTTTTCRPLTASPPPNGEANFKIVGANTLIDKLIAMGLVQESDALGARMMMGLFTTPAEDEDTLTSRIQVEEDGKVLANGQRLR